MVPRAFCTLLSVWSPYFVLTYCFFTRKFNVVALPRTTNHSEPAKGRKYKISEKLNLVKTFIVIYGLKEDMLRFKIKKKVDFRDFRAQRYLLAKLDEIEIVYFSCNFW